MRKEDIPESFVWYRVNVTIEEADRPPRCRRFQFAANPAPPESWMRQYAVTEALKLLRKTEGAEVIFTLIEVRVMEAKKEETPDAG